MGLGVAKVDKHAVPHIPRHEPPEALHGFSDAFLIDRDELSQVFRIHPSGEFGRTDEVREHHRDLPALGNVRRSRCYRWLSRNGSRGHVFEMGNRTQELSAMPERCHADLIEVLIGQVAKNAEINIVDSTAPNMFGHTELCEPVRSLLHRNPPNKTFVAFKTSKTLCSFCKRKILPRAGGHVRCRRRSARRRSAARAELPHWFARPPG